MYLICGGQVLCKQSPLGLIPSFKISHVNMSAACVAHQPGVCGESTRKLFCSDPIYCLPSTDDRQSQSQIFFKYF